MTYFARCEHLGCHAADGFRGDSFEELLADARHRGWGIERRHAFGPPVREERSAEDQRTLHLYCPSHCGAADV